MARRLTENPFRIRWEVTETAANTYTEVDITLPVAVIAGGKAQAVELMKMVAIIEEPSIEPGQSNSASGVLTRDSQTGLINYSSPDLIARHSLKYVGEDAAGVEQSAFWNQTFVYDLTDGDGRGEVIYERTIHAGVLGVGNSQAMTFQGYALVHLVELESDEVAVQAFVDD